MEKVVENQMALSPKQAEKLEQLPPEQRAAQLQIIVKLIEDCLLLSRILPVIIVAIMAAVLSGNV